MSEKKSGYPKSGGSLQSLFAALLFTALLTETALCGGDGNQRFEEYLDRADHYAHVEWEHEKALELLYAAKRKYSDNAEILWRISRAYADRAEVLEKVEEASEEAIKSHYEKAVGYADRAIEENPENSMAHTQRAIATGRMALYSGIWSVIGIVKETHESLERAIELDEFNSIAHFVYARTHAEVSRRSRWLRRPLGLGWAEKATALEHFKRAIELDPDFIMYRLYAARAFAEENEHEHAKSLLEPIPDLDNLTRFDDTYRQEARRLYEKIQGR